MKKLRLEIEQLAVESFGTAEAPDGGRRTVHGRMAESKNCTIFPGETCPMEYSPHIMSCEPDNCPFSFGECPSFDANCPALTTDPDQTC